MLKGGAGMFDFFGKRYYFFSISILVILAGFIGYFYHGGFNLDIQFQGGTILEMQMNDESFSTEKAEKVVMDAIGKKATAQKSQTLNKSVNMLTINIASSDTLTGDQLNTVVDALRKEFNMKEGSEMNVQNVQPFIGAEIKRNGILAVIVSSLLIIVYIWWRFKALSGLSAGVTAVIALLHDAAVMLAVYTLFYIPLNESFIAAVLTILGYSMNDTIIIYDRIRENTGILRKAPLSELANKSIMQTLTRSINTSVTSLISIITVYLFALYNNISSIMEFSFPLIVGMVSGVYSSIFIASPLWVMWKNSQARRRTAAKAAKAS